MTFTVSPSMTRRVLTPFSLATSSAQVRAQELALDVAGEAVYLYFLCFLGCDDVTMM